MRLRRPIRQGLRTIAVLGVLTSALAVAALYRAVAASRSLRLQHARESTAEEIDRLRLGWPTAETRPPSFIGMRGGAVGAPADIGPEVPEAWAPALISLAARARHDQASAYEVTPLPGARLVARVAPLPDGRVAWVAYRV